MCVDLPGAFEAWLGRTEETVDKDLDEVGRVKHSNSSLARGAGDAGPVVELLAELVFKLLERAAAQAHVRLPVRRNAWPEGKAFAVHLSHDMDVLGGRYQLWRRYAGWSARYLASRVGGRREQARRWLGKIHRYRTSSEDHQYTVPRIVDLEGRYGATSSFYFFCSRTRRTWGRRAARMYRLTDPIARDALGVVKSAGSEIGVHAFPGDSCSPSTLARRKELIESVSQTHCVGVRQHYLCLTVPQTWRAQSEAGFGYDATLGWPRNVAMRAGTCLPFVVWDPLAARSLDLYEIPLIAMDGALVVQSPDPAAWLDELRPFIDVTGKHHGVLSLLTHPDRFDEVDYPGQNRFYEMFLQEMKHRGAWLTSGAEIWKAIVRHRRALRRGGAQ